MPVSRVIRTVDNIRSQRYRLLHHTFRGEDPGFRDAPDAFREELSSVILPPDAWAVGRTLADVRARGAKASVNAVRREGIVGRDPSPQMVFKEGDVVVLYGTPAALEQTEAVLLMG